MIYYPKLPKTIENFWENTELSSKTEEKSAILLKKLLIAFGMRPGVIKINKTKNPFSLPDRVDLTDDSHLRQPPAKDQRVRQKICTAIAVPLIAG